MQLGFRIDGDTGRRNPFVPFHPGNDVFLVGFLLKRTEDADDVVAVLNSLDDVLAELTPV